MSETSKQLRVILEPSPEIDTETFQEMTYRLREEIIRLDVEGVATEKSGEVPTGTKAGDPVTWGTLLITLAASGGIITSLINLLQSWLMRNKQSTIIIEADSDRLELTGISSKDQRRLIDEWISNHKLDSTSDD